MDTNKASPDSIINDNAAREALKQTQDVHLSDKNPRQTPVEGFVFIISDSDTDTCYPSPPVLSQAESCQVHYCHIDESGKHTVVAWQFETGATRSFRITMQ